MKPEAFLGALQNNRKTGTNNLGDDSDTWHGIDVNFSTRLEGVLLKGGIATGQRTTDFCGLQAALPKTVFGAGSTYTASRVGGTAGSEGNLLATDFCRVEENWLTNVSVFGSYTFPYDIDVSAAFFSRPGTERQAIYQVPSADVLAALGRPATVAGSVSVNVLPPGTVYGDRLNQLDFRIGKRFNLNAGGNLRASFDIYNVFNANAVSREQYGFNLGAGDVDQYLTPLGLQPGRLAKVSSQLNF